MSNIKQFGFCLLSSIVIGLFSGCAGGSGKPNVVLIIIDTLRADKLGAYGFKGAAVSPELDRYAAEGFTFDRVISQASWTRPSIGSLLTSKYPRTIGLYKEQWDVLPEDVLTAGEFFKSAGYKTVGVTANPNINRIFGFAQGFDSYTDSEVLFRWMGKEDGKVTVKDGRHFERARIPATEVYGKALEEVRRAGKGPFYVQLNIMEVHGGRIIPDSDVDADLKGLKDSGYLQAVRIASRETGKFIEQFKSTISENTIFFIVADHGEGLSDHPGLRKSEGHGAYLYESSVVVPWIVYSPKNQEIKGKRFGRQVQLLNLLPTMAEMAGIVPSESFEGVSLAPVVLGKSSEVALPEVAQTETMMQSANKVAVYGQDWKYIENRDGWKWLPATELQPKGGGELGGTTSKLAEHPVEAQNLKQELSGFESGYSNRPAKGPDEGKLSQGEVDRLRSLGYIK